MWNAGTGPVQQDVRLSLLSFYLQHEDTNPNGNTDPNVHSDQISEGFLC